MRKPFKILIEVVAAFLLVFALIGIFTPDKEPKQQPTAVSSQQPTSTPKPAAKSSSAYQKQHHHHRSGVVLTSCRARDGGKLPDPACTPGATYAKVTQADIHSTICVSGWTDTVRPDEGHTENLKIKQIRMYKYVTTNPFDYEEDHLIPLELGGAPYSPRNLWPEYDHGTIPNPKDAVEDALHNAVCDGRVSLRAAQHAIAHDWTTAEAVLGIGSSGGGGNGGGGGGTPTGCTPKTDSGNCYEPGEFCRDSDHGVTGVAGNGTPIKCEGSGSATWHWEPA
jgi:hypothetical protein